MAKAPKQKPGRSKQDYGTPTDFLEAVKHRFCIQEFSFDFAADSSNHKAAQWWSIEHDSLKQSPQTWAAACAGGWGWLNPEFADIGPWAELCMKAKMFGARIPLLVPAGVGANWFRDYVDGQALVLMLNGRLCFIENWATTIDPSTLKPGKGPARFYSSAPLYPKDCILCLYSPTIKPGYEVWDWRNQIKRAA